MCKQLSVLMVMHMRNHLLVLACLWGADHARPVQTTSGQSQTNSAANERLLWALNLSAAFNPGADATLSPSRNLLRLLMSAAIPSPPVAKRVPHKVIFGKVEGENRGPDPMEPTKELVDDYFWLRNSSEDDEEEILELLRQENAYTQARTEHLETLQAKLLGEIRSRSRAITLSNIALVAIASSYAIGVARAYLMILAAAGPLVAAAAALLATLGAFQIFYFKSVDAAASEKLCAEDGYEYWSRRSVLGGQLLLLRRRQGTPFGEEVILDLNQVCTSSFFVQTPGWQAELCDLEDASTSPSGNLLAYSIDGSGKSQYTLRFKDLRTGAEFDEQIFKIASFVWADETTVFYTSKPGDRSFKQIWRHNLGTQPTEDTLVYEELEHQFSVFVKASRDRSLIIFGSQSLDATELYFIPAKTPQASPTLIRARQPGVYYSVDSHAPSQSLFIVANLQDKPNGDLFVASLNSPSAWKPVIAAGTEVLAHSTSRSIQSVDVFSSFLVVTGRENGFNQLWVLPLGVRGADGHAHRMSFDADTCTAVLAGNNLFDPDGKVRVSYSSMTVPEVLLEYDIKTREYKTLKTSKLDKYDPGLYKTDRIEVTSRDGVAIPVTILWRPDAVGNALEAGGGGAPCHLYGYGSYGSSCDPTFFPERLSLVDRGIVYAIAHVRGGGERGRHAWYEMSGKYLKKRNTFSDFVDVAEALVERGIAKQGALTCEGASAGGLLIGNVINMAPELFAAAIANVPFVDLMVDMCKEDVEWAEWGNPNEARYHDYMMSYSPVDNVCADKIYPNILINSGYLDPLCPYFQATKWAQVLRSRIANGDDVLLKTDFSCSHWDTQGVGTGAELDAEKEAFNYAWLLDKLGKAD